MKARHFAGGAAVILSWLLLSNGVRAQEHCYVRGAPAPVQIKGGPQVNGLSIAFTDASLPVILTNRSTYAAVDLVMSQCYGGGFGPFLTATPPAADWTFCSASRATQEARGVGGLISQGTGLYVDNFTRAWREDAHRSPLTSMVQHFQTATNGNQNPRIRKDRYIPPTTSIPMLSIPSPGPQGPVYNSYYLVYGTLAGQAGFYVYVPDPPNNRSGWVQVEALASPPGGLSWQVVGTAGFGIARPNTRYRLKTDALIPENPQYTSAGTNSDRRTLGLPDPNTNNTIQYAILVQWDKPDKVAFASNLSRVYYTLTNVCGVPADNIVVLYNDGRFANGSNSIAGLTLLPGPLGMLSETNPTVPIDGATGLDSTGTNRVFRDLAVPGRLFKQNGVAGFPPTNGNPRLLLYFTGHGSRGIVPRSSLTYNATDRRMEIQLLPRDFAAASGSGSGAGFDTLGEFADAATSFLLAQSGADPDDDASFWSNTNNVLDSFQGPVDLVQISTAQPIPYGVELSINGSTNAAWYPLLPVTDPAATVYDLDPLVPGSLTNTYTYQFMVDNMVLHTGSSTNGAGAEIDLEFNGLNASDFDPNLVTAVLVRGAEQEVAYLPQDPTVVAQLTGQNLGGGMLLSWPGAATNYYIEQNPDLLTTNWVTVTNLTTLQPLVTGTAAPTFPTGTNWAFISYTSSQMYFRLRLGP